MAPQVQWTLDTGHVKSMYISHHLSLLSTLKKNASHLKNVQLVVASVLLASKNTFTMWYSLVRMLG